MSENEPISTSPEQKQAPSLESLVAQLSSFALERDSAFRRGDSDAVSINKESRRCVGLVYDDAKEREIAIYNKQKISFTAERTDYETRSKKPKPPTYFNVRLDTVTQIDKLPPSLQHYFDEEAKQNYEETEPGDLSVLHAVEYVVKRDDDGVIDITRNMIYNLRDGSDIIFYVDEAGAPDQYELVEVPTEQNDLHVGRIIPEEKVSDEAERVSYHAHYEQTISQFKHLEHAAQLSETSDADATIAILALMNSLKTGKSLKTDKDKDEDAPDLFVNETLKTYELQQEYDHDEWA